MPINPFATEDDPNYQRQGADDTISMLARQRLERLKQGYPTASRFIKPPEPTPSIDDLLSRFLKAGSQTAPASPKRNRQGVEDETEMK